MANTLFSIQLRISSELIDLPVLQNDTNLTLLNRLCDHQTIKKQFRKILKQKLKESLSGVIKRKNFNKQLKSKVQKIMNDQQPQTTKYQLPDCLPNIKIHQKKKQETQNQSSSVLRISKHNLTQNQNNLTVPLETSKQKKLLEVPHIRKPNNIIAENKLNETNKDIILAYETVHSKCKDPELKLMIQKTLNELKKGEGFDYLNFRNSAKYTPMGMVTPLSEPSNPQNSNDLSSRRKWQSKHQYESCSVEKKLQKPCVQKAHSRSFDRHISGFMPMIDKSLDYKETNSCLSNAKSTNNILRSRSGGRKYNYLVRESDSLY